MADIRSAYGSTAVGLQTVTSAIVTVGTEIVLDGIDSSKTHCFIGTQYFDDAAGTMVASPTGGKVTLAVETVNSAPVFEPFTGDIIAPAAIFTASVAANVNRVKATPLTISGATHWRIVVTCNDT